MADETNYRPHPEEVTRSLPQARLRASGTRYGVTVSKDGRGERRLWPSFETARANKRAPPQDEA